nr:MAG TPA: hypothetical protein [Caudoviricetes sp.]
MLLNQSLRFPPFIIIVDFKSSAIIISLCRFKVNYFFDFFQF